MTHYIPEGTTEAQDFELRADGTAIDGTGLTLGITVEDKNGVAVALAGSVAWLDANAGTVRYLPDAADLPRSGSPYDVRWSVTDGSSRVAYSPNGRTPDKWVVVQVP